MEKEINGQAKKRHLMQQYEKESEWKWIKAIKCRKSALKKLQ